MRTLWMILALLLATLTIAPHASAEPCEVPGCDVGPAAVCIVQNAKAVPKHADDVLRECLTTTTSNAWL